VTAKKKARESRPWGAKREKIDHWGIKAKFGTESGENKKRVDFRKKEEKEAGIQS